MWVHPRILIEQLVRCARRQRPVALLPLLVMAGGLLLTAGVCEQTRRFGVQKHLRIETTLLNNMVDALRNKLDVNIALLAAVVGLFNASNGVDRQQFSTFFETISLNTTQLRGGQGVGFARWIPAGQLQAYEARIRSEGFPSFTVRPPGPRADYSAIEFLEPFDWSNERAFGFDMFSEPVRRQAMQRAWRTGHASVTGKVQLVQDTQETRDDQQAGVLIFLPIDADRGQVQEGNRRALLGWAYSPLRINDVVNGAIAGIDNTDLAGTGVLVFDGDQPDARQLLFDNLGLLRRNQLRHPSYETIEVAGRTWLVGVQLANRLVGPNGIDTAYWMNLIVGLGSSLVAALITRILVSNHLATREALAISEAAAQERALASTVFEESGQGILVSNPDGRILMANNAFTQLTGYRLSEIKGQRTNLLKSGRHDNAFYQQMWDELIHKGFWEGDIWNRVRSGEIRCHHLSISTVRDETLEPQYYVGMLQDVTERQRAEQAVRFMAQHDTLTGLANRSMMMEQLDRHLALAKRHGHAVALLYLDLDGFKPVNDRFGHNVGDRVLQMVAERFRRVIREGDLLCRQGGDEFVVLVPEAGSTDELIGMALKLVEASQAPYSEIDPSITLSASVGIARYPEHGNNAEQLLSAADNAMYAAKRAKVNPVKLCNGSPASPQPVSPQLDSPKQTSSLLESPDDHCHQHEGSSQGDQQGNSHG